MSHNSLRDKLLAKPAVQSAYSELKPVYSLLRQILKARQKAGLSRM